MLLICVLLLQAPPEKIEIPGTQVSFEAAPLPGSGPIRPFAVGVKEVTWKEFNLYRGDQHPIDGVVRPIPPEFFPTQAEILPKELDAKEASATYIRWHSAIEYCAWLSRKTKSVWRLPTESEWLLAAKSTPAAKDFAGGMWEYALEWEEVGRYGPVILGGGWELKSGKPSITMRRGIPLDWYNHDPNAPRSSWYLVGSPASAGFRVVRVEGAESFEARQAYLSQVQVRVLKGTSRKVTARQSRCGWVVLEIEISNTGEKTLDEIEVQVHALTVNGQPHLSDAPRVWPGIPTFSRVWPVLASSRDEARRAPLKAGESRRFETEIPESCLVPDEVDGGKWGGRATAVRFVR